MHHGFIPHMGEAQPFYYPPDNPTMLRWLKGMEQIIREHSLWPDGSLPSECLGFRCLEGQTDCCYCHLLFNQPDFVFQKSSIGGQQNFSSTLEVMQEPLMIYSCFKFNGQLFPLYFPPAFTDVL